MANLNSREIQLTLCEKCNLNCVYCYEHNKDANMMDFNLAKKIIEHEFSLAEQDGINHLEIYFHGGEICIVFNLLKRICEWIWLTQWNLSYHCSATTNGTLVHGEIQKWFKKNANRFTLGLSLDGNRTLHNLNRCNSYDNIDLKFFAETYPNKHVKMTISPLTIHGLADGIIDIIEKGFKVSANLAYDCDWDDDKLKRQYAKELFLLSNFFISKPQIIPPRKLFDKDLIDLGIQIYNKDFFKPQRSCGSGINMCCYDAAGKKYPCQMFLPSSTGEITYDSQVTIEDNKLSYSKECKECAIFPICPNCIGYHYAKYQKLIRKPDVMCDYKKIEILNYTFFLSEIIKNDGVFLYHEYNSVKDALNTLAIAFLQRELRNSDINKYVTGLTV